MIKGKNCMELVSWVLQMKSKKRKWEIIDSSMQDKDHEREQLELIQISCTITDQDPRRRPTVDPMVSWLNGIGSACNIPKFS